MMEYYNVEVMLATNEVGLILAAGHASCDQLESVSVILI